MLRFRHLSGLLPLPLLFACAGSAPVATSVAALPEAVEPAAGPPSETVAGHAAAGWPHATSCSGLVAGLAELAPEAFAGLDPRTAPLALVGGGSIEALVERDLPIPLAASADAAPASCLLLLGEPAVLPTVADRVLDRRSVRSTYAEGSRRRRNPDHQALERDLAAAKREAKGDFDVLVTGDPMLDLIGTLAGGLLDGLGRIDAGREIASLETALETTPAYLEETTEAAYRYQIVELEAERRSRLPVVLFDGTEATAVADALLRTERQRFLLANDRHPRDSTPSPVPGVPIVTTEALAAWRAASPRVTTSELVAHMALAIARGAPARSATSGQALAELHQPPAPDLANASSPIGAIRPLADGLVQVGGDAGTVGFYVTAEHIVAPSSALAESSLVAVRYPDGVAAYGMVELNDEALGLALIYLPRQGVAPARAVTASAAPATASATVPGVPWVDGDSIVGLYSTDPLTAEPRWISAAELDRFVARLDTL